MKDLKRRNKLPIELENQRGIGKVYVLYHLIQCQMNTITVTKTNYFDVINLINNKLLQKQKIFVQVEAETKGDILQKIEKMYDGAMKEYKAGKTIYWGTVVKHGK